MVRILLFVVLVAGGIAAGFYGTGPLLDRFLGQEVGARETEGGAEPEPEGQLVTTDPAETRVVQDTVQAVGTVEPVRSIEIRPLSEGRVTEVFFEPGARVEAREALFALDDRAERASLAQAEATLVEERRAFGRAEDLADSDIASAATFDAARARFLRAEAVVAEARNALDDRRLEAPFAGVMGLADLDPGERVDPTTVITTLDDLDAVRVEFSVPERYFGQVAVGQDVVLQGAGAGSASEGVVSAIAPRIEEGTRSFAIRATVPNEGGMLVGGMFVTVLLVLEERRAVTVPEEAILSEGDTAYVFTLEDGKAVRHDVVLGRRSEGRVEVEGGIEEAAAVIASGTDALSDGDAVRVRTDTAAAE